MAPTEPVAPDALLVRVSAEEADWAVRLPPVPARASSVTVTVGDDAVLRRSSAALAAAGYRIAGSHPAAQLPDGSAAADLLVPDTLRTLFPGWWERLHGRATRIYDLRHGPVLALLGPVIHQHLDARHAGGVRPPRGN